MSIISSLILKISIFCQPIFRGGKYMNNEITGHYNKQKERLLKDLKQTIEKMKSPLADKYGENFAYLLQNEILLEYEEIIPEIPYFKGFRNSMFNSMLIITSQILAAYRVLKRYDKTDEEIWLLCFEAIRLRLQEIPLWKRYLMKQLWHNVFSKILRRRGKNNLRETLGNFEIEYLDSNGDNYDFGINYTKCAHNEFLKKQNAEEFLPYVCLADIALSDAFGWGLIRTQTLGDRCEYCDFRFKKGAFTQVSSKTLETQTIIDKLPS